MRAIVLAGGRGSRLGEAALNRPKVLVALDESHTILGVILHQLRRSGFGRVTLCVSHLAEMVYDTFGDGTGLDLAIDYCIDTAATGTAGPLRAVPDFDAPALVMNGDLLTTMDYAELYAAHADSGAVLTISAVPGLVPVDHGVLEVRDGRVVAIAEKPRLSVTISGGVYVASPRVRGHLAIDRPTDMPDLVTALIAAGETVHAHPTPVAWFDIGTPTQLDRARTAFTTDRDRFLGAVPVVRAPRS